MTVHRSPAFAGRRIDVLVAIAASLRGRGIAPTLRELKAILRMRSVSNVQYHLVRLERAGLVARGATWRSMTITPEGETLLGMRDVFAAETAVERLELGA